MERYNNKACPIIANSQLIRFESITYVLMLVTST